MKKVRNKRSTQEFIKDCNIIHSNFYNYSKTEYIKMHSNIDVICPIHGQFNVEANHHIRGTGCKKCSINHQMNNQKDTTESFIKKAKKIHKDTYDYSKVKYGKNAHDKVILLCKEHGEFLISPNSHLSKAAGCLLCAKEKCGWTKTSWKKACRNKIAKLYIINCFNNDESFYKIGITSNSLEKRFNCSHWMPYNYKIIKIIESEDSDYIFDLEKKLHKINRKYKYKPKIFFDGFSECFSNYADCH